MPQQKGPTSNQKAVQLLLFQLLFFCFYFRLESSQVVSFLKIESCCGVGFNITISFHVTPFSHESHCCLIKRVGGCGFE